MTPTIRLSLPYFQSGQVLKHDDLNNLAAYLEEQDRLTRVMLVGIGIVEGFTFPEADSGTVDPASISVGSGIGISSDGHLFWQERNRTFTSFFERDLLPSAIMCPPEDSSSDNSPIPVLELLMDGQQPPQPTNGTPAPEVKSLSELTDGEYVLVLQKKAITDDSSRCFKETETRTANKYYEDKFLLVPRANYPLCQTDDGDDDGDGIQDLRRPWIRRFGFDSAEDSILLDNILSFEAFSANYAQICAESFGVLQDAMMLAYEKYSETLGLTAGNPFAQLATDLNAKLEQYEEAPADDVNRLGIQYLYDYQRVLIAAYHEFLECAADLRLGGQMMPDRCLHPRHLALGIVQPTEQGTEVAMGGCRSIFRSSAFHSENTGKQRKATFLLDRLKALVRIREDATDNPEDVVLLPWPLSAETPIRITPSRGALSELSEHPIPYYLDTAIKGQWNFFLKETNQTAGILGYHLTTNTRPYDRPALYDLSAYSFFRIEGHLGKTAADAYRELRDLRKKMDLPFDLQFVKLGEEIEETGLQELLAEDLQLIYAAARVDILCRVEELLGEDDSLPLNFLPEAITDFDDSEFDRQYSVLKASIGNPNTTDIDCRIPTLKNLYEEFRERHYAFHLFHLFADRHPGLEFLSGVPKGGTWVVVYADVPDLGDTLVVGDFALPYSCCADRGGAVFPEPYIAASPGHFCHTDGEEYELITYPSGGVLTGTLMGASDDDATTIDDFVRRDSDTGKYYFHPEAVPTSAFTAGTAIVQLSYRKHGKTAQGKLLVYQQPTVAFQRRGEPVNQYDDDGKLIGQQITFAVTEIDPEDATLEWIISGEDTRIVDSGKGEMTADFKYSEGVFYEVVLVAKNGSCRTEERLKFTICEESPQVSVEPADGIRFGDETAVRVTATPRGGVFRLIDPDEHVLSPSLEPTDTDDVYLLPAEVFDQAGNYTLVYALPQCLEEARVTIEVRRPPIELSPSTFCSDDETEYPIQLNVPGRFADDQPGVVAHSDGHFSFVPAEVPIELYTPDGPALIELQFTTDEGVVATLPVTVFAVPTFVETGRRPLYEETEDGNGTVRCLRTGWTVDFEVEPAIWTDYDWQGADQPVTEDTETVSLDFSFGLHAASARVTVAVATEAFPPADCRDSHTEEVDISCPEVRIGLADQDGTGLPAVIPGSDPTLLDVDPIGGQFNLQAVTMNEDDEEVLTDAPEGLEVLIANDRPCTEEATVYSLAASENVISGRYRLTYGIENCTEGASFDFIVRPAINTLSGSAASGTTTTGTAGGGSLPQSPVMVDRFAQRRQAIEDIRTDPNVPRSNAFRFTEELMEEDLDLTTLNERFVAATNAAAQKVDEANSDESRDLYNQLFTTAFLYYLDRLVANSAQQIPQSSRDVLEAQLADLEPMVDLNEATTRWDAEALQAEIDAPAIDQIRSLLPTEEDNG